MTIDALKKNRATAPGLIQRALISVYDKDELLSLAKGLHELDIELLCSGGTARTLNEAGIPITHVEAFTKAPEVLGGRVKTLHPKIHAGILADRRIDAHMTELTAQGYQSIDLVICNLYPFAKAANNPKSNHEEIVENIDIGGPTLLRAAAKNAEGGVTVLYDKADYRAILTMLQESDNMLSLELRRVLATKTFAYVAQYDAHIDHYFSAFLDSQQTPEQPLPQAIGAFEQQQTLRYGENPHQNAALYTLSGEPGGVGHAQLLTGKELSYNNYLDLDAAHRGATQFEETSCAIVKHSNVCGLAIATNQTEAFKRALEGDPVSAFGSVIGFNRPLDSETVQAIKDAKLFVECIVAPGFTDKARDMLAARTNLRLVQVDTGKFKQLYHTHRISGGMLVQQIDAALAPVHSWQCVTDRQPEPGWLEQLEFAMQAAAQLKSNAIAICNNFQLHGAGCGQTSRVDATEQAIKKAAGGCDGGFLASDAFFPFDDCVQLAHKAGIIAVVQPGGSKRDDEVIAAANRCDMVMMMTGRRHFRH